MHLIDPLHIWLACLLIVTPIPQPWIKPAIALIVTVVIAVSGG